MDRARAALEAFGIPDVLARAQVYAERKQRRLEELIAAGDFTSFADGVAFAHGIKSTGLKLAAASSSKNATDLLRRVGLLDLMNGSHHGPLMPCSIAQGHPCRFDGPPRVVAAGFQLAEGRLIGPQDMFDDPSFDEARHTANVIADYLREHGPFEPHRLPLTEMEYTTMPQLMDRLAERWTSLNGMVSAPALAASGREA